VTIRFTDDKASPAVDVPAVDGTIATHPVERLACSGWSAASWTSST
jgi:hypothetical protein